MLREEAIAFFMDMDECTYGSSEPIQMAIEALKQESREGEVILTKKEYGELVSSEFDNGYTKGYTEALEQNDVLNKIRVEIQKLRNCSCSCSDGIIDDVVKIIDKYKAGEEEWASSTRKVIN